MVAHGKSRAPGFHVPPGRSLALGRRVVGVVRPRAYRRLNARGGEAGRWLMKLQNICSIF